MTVLQLYNILHNALLNAPNTKYKDFANYEVHIWDKKIGTYGVATINENEKENKKLCFVMEAETK